MAITKTGYTIQTSTSKTAGSADTTSSAVDLSTEKGFAIVAKMTPAGTLGVACTLFIEVSNDNTNWRTWRSVQSDLAATLREFAFVLPKEIMYVRTRFSGNTTSACTIEALGMGYEET